MEQLEDRITPSAIAWTGGANTLNWGDGGNWSGGVVPTSADDVTINKSGVGTINIGASSFARTLNDTTAALSIASGGSLALSAVAATSTLDQNVTVQSGGALSVGAGASVVMGPPTVPNGTLTLADNGTLTFASGDTVTLNSDYGDYATTQIVVGSRGLLQVSGATFIAGPGSDTSQIAVNSGGQLQVSSSMLLENGFTLVNDSGAVLNLTNDANISESGGATLTNDGTLEKTGGTGNAIISTSFANDGGTINVQSGTLTLDSAGGTSTGGTFEASKSATLDLTGGATVAYQGTYTGTGAGTVALASGTLKVGSGGTTFNMAGSLFQYTGGSIDVSSGSFTNANTINYAGSGNVALNGAGSLINKKSILQTSTGTLTLENGASLNNAAGSIYNIESNGGISQSGGGTLINAGTLEKTAGTGTSTIATSTLNSTGIVSVSSGTLGISATVSQVSGSTLTAGTWTVSGSPTVHSTLAISSAGSLTTIGSQAHVTLSGLNSSFTNINGASGLNAILAGGSVSILAGQSFTTAGGLSNAGSVILNDGTLNITGPVAQLSGTTLNGGTWTVGPSSNLNFPAGSNITALAGAHVTLNGANSNFAALANLGTIGSTSSFMLLGKRSFNAVGSLTNNGKLTVGPGRVLTAKGSFTQASTASLTIQLGGTNAVPAFGQVVSSSSTVTLGGTLQVKSTIVPAVGSSFEILANQGGAPISGTFAGLAEGSTFTAKYGTTTMTFKISYLGGGGNNVVITRVS